MISTAVENTSTEYVRTLKYLRQTSDIFDFVEGKPKINDIT